MSMLTRGSAEEHLRTFALSQASLLAQHLQGASVDYTFVARHARTLLQLAEDAEDQVWNESAGTK